jgi:aryl sulfotransferase
MTTQLPQLQHAYQNHHLDSTRWQQYRPRNGDIVISTSYKAGTTWMQGIVYSLIFLGKAAPASADLSPWLEVRGTPVGQVLEKLEAQKHRRYIKTHLALDGLPYYPQVRYIMVARDVRDVFMSLWNHHSNLTDTFYKGINGRPDRVGDPLPSCPQDIHEFWHDWITRSWFAWESEGYPYWGNMHHNQSWWEYRGLENILLVHYNDLLSNLQSELRQLADFLGIDASDSELASIVPRVSIESMRREAEARNQNAYLQGGAQTFYFKGTNGRWKDVLSADELALYEQVKAKVLTPECAAWLEQGGRYQTT